MTEETFNYDVFISHSSKDKPVVRELAEQLKADSLRVWFDEWEIKPGDLIGLKIEEGLEQSRTLILVMSANSFASEWVMLERHTAMFRDPTNSQRRFIPLRLDDAEIKDTLKQFAYVDWQQRSDEQYARLLAACRPPKGLIKLSIEEEYKEQPKHVLKGHTSFIYGLTVTLDGRRAVSCSNDWTVRLWDLQSKRCVGILKGHTKDVVEVVVTADGRWAISGSYDKTIRVWDLDSRKCVAVLVGHTDRVKGLAVATDGQRVISCSDDGTVRVWDLDSRKCIAIVEEHRNRVAMTSDGRQAIFYSNGNTMYVWDINSQKIVASLVGHTAEVNGVMVTADGRRAVSASDDRTIRVWDLDSSACVTILEGHTGPIYDVAVTADGRRAVSASDDRTVRVWDLDSGVCVATLEGHTNAVMGVAMTPDGRRAVSMSKDRTLRVWDLLPINAEEATEEFGTTRYTNAKVLLVGDSGVGKTGLAIRLAEDRFEPTISTDAVWATQIKLPHDASTEDTEREIWLWDFAGQADYRLIHQLFMDETALAVLVFNPQSENPFEGLGQWDRDLQRAARRPFRKLLVAGRCDRGGLMISRNSIERFRQERSFTHYLETSAYTGDGCHTLHEAIIRNIPWSDIPWTASPRIFKLLKKEIVKLKDEGKVLLRMGELKQQLEMRLVQQSLQDVNNSSTITQRLWQKILRPNRQPSASTVPETFTLEQLRGVIGLLAGPGVVWQLEFGDFILLQPERINAYAAAVIRKVRAHTEEIGIILEEDVLAGKLDYQDMKRLPPDEEQIVLRAMHQTFLDHGLCLREHTGAGTLLVFPSYFKRERPELESHPAVFVSYQFNGQLDEIYSTLVVRLHHTTAFHNDQFWRFAADFKTQAGKRVGFKMTKQGEGTAEIAVYFEPGIADDTKVTFIRYVHEHLKVKAQDVIRLRHYVCSHCDTPVENRKTAWKRLNQGLKDILCVNCERRVPLWDLIEQKFASDEFQQRVREMEEQARISIDKESRELILVGHAFAIAGETGQIYRQYASSNHGINGEIEFKNDKGEASGKRVYLQLKSDDSYLQARKVGDKEIFKIAKPRYAQYWLAQAYPVMLVIRASDGQIRWMNVTDYLNQQEAKMQQIVFEGEPFTALSVVRLRDHLFDRDQTTNQRL